MAKIKTIEDAFEFVRKVKICTIFASDKIPPSPVSFSITASRTAENS